MNSPLKVNLYFWVKLLIVSLSVLMLIPYYSSAVPEWKITAVKPDGGIPESIAIRQEWSSYSVIPISTDVRTTDEAGIVTFPERRFLCPLLGRLLLRSVDTLNSVYTLHGGRVGRYSRVTTAQRSNSYWLEYHEGGDLPERLEIYSSISMDDN